MNAHQSAQHDTLLHGTAFLGGIKNTDMKKINKISLSNPKNVLKCKEDEEGAAAQVHVGRGNILDSQKIKKKRDKGRERERTEEQAV